MKKLNLLPAIAMTVAVVLAFTMSSFRNHEVKKAAFANSYFKFDLNSARTEANLETESKWQVVSLPGSNPCTVGTNAPCISHVDETLAQILPADDNATRITKFVNYMKAQASAETYIANNTDYHRQ